MTTDSLTPIASAAYVCVFCDLATEGRLTECPRCNRQRCFARRVTWHRLQIAAALAWLAIGGWLGFVVGWIVWPRPGGANIPDAWWVLPLIILVALVFLIGGVAGVLGRPWLYRWLVLRFSRGWFG